MCDGQVANGCDFISLAEFETILAERSAKLDDQFSIINEVLQVKKEVFMEMYRKDPRKSHAEAVFLLKAWIEFFNPTNPEEVLETAEVNSETIDDKMREWIKCWNG